MGQKVNPVGMRIGINRDWNTHWYADKKEFSTYLLEDINIRKFITNFLQKIKDSKDKDKKTGDKDVYLSNIEIDRVKTDKGLLIKVNLHLLNGGILAGNNDQYLNQIKAGVIKIVKNGTKGRVELRYNVIKRGELDATIMAKRIANQLENRVSFRIAQKKAIQQIKKAGALGVKTEVSGRLAGADIARSEGYKDGILSLHTLRSDIDYAAAEARTIYGRLGIKVWICRGEKEIKPRKVKEGE